MAMAAVGLNVANELIGKILLQITETCRAAHDVVVEKKSFREFSSHINRIEPILLELWKKNVQGSSESVKMALEKLADELNNASNLIKSYTSGSWMYLFLRCRLLPDEMKQITQGIERCLNSLRIANLDVSIEIKEKTLALCETMRNAEFKAEVVREALVAEIEREMKEMQSDSQQVLQLIVQVAKAMDVPVDQCFLESEIESVRKRKEDLEDEKQRAEACMLEQIQGFLCRSGMVSTDSSSSPVCQSVPLYFFCPLTDKIMEDPVELESGITYERRAIEEWLESGKTTCPVKKCELLRTQLIPNYNLRELIQEWKEKNVKFKIESAAAKLVAGANQKDVEEALVELCSLCRDRSSSRQAVGEKGLIPTILRFTSFEASSVQGKAMECLSYLAKEDGNKEKIANAGGIEQTVNHLTEETEMKNLTVSLLLELSKAPQLCQMIGETRNSIPLLVSMLSGPHAEKSREILKNLSEVDVNVIEMAEVNFYEPLVFQLMQGSLRTKTFLATAVSRMEPLDCGKAVTGDGGILSPLVQMIQENNPEAMTTPLSALKNLSRTEENCVYILDAEVASLLFRLMFLGSLKVDLREQAAYILANLATASSRKKKVHPKLKSLASEENIKTMLESLSLARTSLKVHLLQILLGLASNSSTIKDHMRNTLGIPVLLTLMCNPQLKVRLNVMKLLSCLADGGENELAENLKETHMNALVDGINADNEEERVVCVGILCRLPKDVSRIRNVLQETGALDAIVRLISLGESRNGNIRAGGFLIENALGALLHFTSPSNLSVQKRAVELGVVPLLVGFLLAGSSLSKQRAATALGQISESTMSTSIEVRHKSNILSYACGWWTSPDPEDVCPVHERICATEASFCLVHAGAVEPLVQTLRERDSQADEAALNALNTLLDDNIWEAGLKEIEKAEGVEPIVELLKNGSPEAQEKATLVLEKIFRKAEYIDLYGSSARFSLIDIMQQGPISTRRVAMGILHLLGEMPEDSGWLQSQ